MKKVLFSGIIFLSFSLLGDSGLIDEIYQKMAPIYEKHEGVLSVREITAVSKDPENGEVLKRFEAKIERRDHFYKTPQIKALKYVENGKETRTSKYDTREIEPFYPVFDKNGKAHYDLKIAGNETVTGRNCVKIQVIPKSQTTRHFKGYIFVDPQKLEIVKMAGSPAKLHWAMLHFSFDYHYNSLEGFPVLSHGTVKARVKVALFVSDNITDYTLKAVSNRFY
jgi:hypothetical protein